MTPDAIPIGSMGQYASRMGACVRRTAGGSKFTVLSRTPYRNENPVAHAGASWWTGGVARVARTVRDLRRAVCATKKAASRQS